MGTIILFALLASQIPSLAFLSNSWLISFLSITLSVFLARRWFDRRSFRSLGLSLNRQATLDAIVGILIAGAVMAFVFLVEWALGWLRFDGFATASGQATLTKFSYWAAIFVLVGWYEELWFRGYWLQNLRDGVGIKWALFISAAFFALSHLSNPNVSWVAILGLLVAGCFLAFGYLRTNQLWLAIGLHIGWNFFEGPVFSFPVSGLESSRLLNIQVRGPELITGGPFGPEAGLIILPAMVLGAILIYSYTQKRRKNK